MSIKRDDIIPWVVITLWVAVVLIAIVLAVVTELGKAVALWKYIFS